MAHEVKIDCGYFSYIVERMDDDEIAAAGLMTRDEIRSLPTEDPPAACGLYFLLKGDEIVYIGMSRDICRRIYSHERSRANYLIAWDSCRCVRLPESEIEALEARYIQALQPLYNIIGARGERQFRP